MEKQKKCCENCQVWTRDSLLSGTCTLLSNQARYIAIDPKTVKLNKVRTDSYGICKNFIAD